MSSDVLLIIAAIIIIVSWVIIARLRRSIKRMSAGRQSYMDRYNLEYPADFVEKSSADDDMDDRFMGRHYK